MNSHSDLEEFSLFQSQLIEFEYLFSEYLTEHLEFQKTFADRICEWSALRIKNICRVYDLADKLDRHHRNATIVKYTTSALTFAGSTALGAIAAPFVPITAPLMVLRGIKIGTVLAGLTTVGTALTQKIVSDKEWKQVEEIVCDEDTNWEYLFRGFQHRLRRCEAVENKLKEICTLASSLRLQMIVDSVLEGCTIAAVSVQVFEIMSNVRGFESFLTVAFPFLQRSLPKLLNSFPVASESTKRNVERGIVKGFYEILECLSGLTSNLPKIQQSVLAIQKCSLFPSDVRNEQKPMPTIDRIKLYANKSKLSDSVRNIAGVLLNEHQSLLKVKENMIV